jgi:hypothetical protein
MTDAELIARLDAIERRLAALERAPVVPPQAAHPSPPNAVSAVPHSPPLPSSPAPPPIQAHAPSPPHPVHQILEAKRSTASAPPSFAPPLVTPAARPAASASTSPAGLERFLGGQVAAWIGGIVVIAAIGIFAKFAIDQGWFARTPPAAKLALAYALSGAFVIAGSLLHGRLGRLPAGSMLAAGIGGLFVSTCAGVTPLNVLGPTAALVAGLAAAVIGGALTLRSRELAVASIALIGAYVVPAFANIYLLAGRPAGEPPITGALYLTGVYAVALALARLGPPSFAWLRLAGAFQAISAGLLILDAGRASPALSLGFTVLWWAMAVAECSLAALRGTSPRLNTAVTVAATSIAATLALRGALATDPWSDVHSWLPALMAALALAGSVQLRALVPSGGIDRRDRQDDPRAAAVAAATARQSTVLAILAAALVIVQVGVVVRGGALPVAWAAMGAAAILVGSRMAQPWTARVGIASCMLSVIATVAIAVFGVGTAATLIEYPAGPAMRSTTMWAFRITDAHWSPIIVAVLLVVGARSRSVGSDPNRRAPMASGVLAACAMLIWIGLSLSIGSAYAAVTMLLAIPAAAIAGGRTVSLIKLIAIVGSSIASLGWFAATIAHVSRYYGTAEARPQGGATAAALVVGSFLMTGQRFRGERFRDVPTVIGFAFGLTALAMLLLIEQLVGATSGDVTRATMWSCTVVAVVATLGARASKQAGLELSQGLGLIATALSVCVALFAIGADALRPPQDVTWLHHWLLTPANASLLAFAGCGLALRPVCVGRPESMTWFGAVAAAAFLIGSGALVLRVLDPRVGAPFPTTAVIQQSALSVWLAMAAVGFVVHGFRRHMRALRWTGLVLLGAVAIKVLVLDMANAGTIWRVIALLVTGLLLVATSAVYSRAAKAQPHEHRVAPPR